MLGIEAIRTAQAKFGKKPMTGEQVRWGLENLDLTAERIKELGFEGVLQPDQGLVRRSRGRAHRPHPDLGRQELEASRPTGTPSDDNVIAADGQGRGGQIRGREEDHARVPARTDDQPGRRIVATTEAAQRRLLPASARRRRASAATSAAAPILSVNNIEVVYDHVILVLKGVSLRGARGRDRRAPRRERRRQVDHAQGDLQSALGRARRSHQGLDRLRRATRCMRCTPERAGAARLHPGDGRAPLLRPSLGRGEPAHRRLSRGATARRRSAATSIWSIPISRA